MPNNFRVDQVGSLLRPQKVNNPRLQAEGVSICRLELDSCFRHSGFIVTPVKTGVHPNPPLTWILFSNGMTDTVRHLDAGGSLS